MATTTNYSWTTPDNTDLVKNGALAIRTLGSAIDTTVFNNANLALGVRKNYLINGGFAIAQRGTTYTSTGSANNDDAYVLDRWYILSDGNDVIDVNQETTTVPTNGQFAIGLDVETVNKKFGIATIIENKDCIGLIGNTVTFSFKAKVSATTKLDNVKAAIVAWSGTADTVTSDIISAWGVEGTNPTLVANATYEATPSNLSVTTSYATYNVSATVDTASTKNLILFIWSDVTDTTLGDFLYIAEAKLELGSTATAFVYAGETIQGELAACQRYYYRVTDPATSQGYTAITVMHDTNISGATTGNTIVSHPVPMRVPPISTDITTLAFHRSDGTLFPITAVTIDTATDSIYGAMYGLTLTGSPTSGNVGRVIGNNSTTTSFAVSAEL
jgi:hypothetical protein